MVISPELEYKKSMEKSKAKNILLKGLGFSLAIAPALLIAILISRNSVNVPFWDDWAVGIFLSQVFPEFRPSLELFIFQHNESRYTFPRLIFIALTYINNGIWNLKSQMWFSLGLACLISVNIFSLIKLTVKGNLLKVIFLTILCNFLIFAPIQYENWLWGIQLIVFMPIVCLTTGLVVIYSGINRITKLIICLILCTVSTYSYANGMLSWVIFLPIFALSKSWKWEGFLKEKWFYLAWLSAFTANILVYFTNYKKPEGTPSFIYGITHLDKTIKYFLSFLGAPLGWGTFNSVDWQTYSLLNHTIIIGLIIILLFLGAFLYLLKHRQEPEIIYRMSGWLTIASYTVISGLITSIGRVGYGLETSYSVRYTTFSVYLPLALINLSAIIYDDAKTRGYLIKKSKRFAQAVILILLTSFLYLHILTSEYAMPQYFATKLDRLYSKSCLLFINVLKDEKCLSTKVYSNVKHLEGFVQILDNNNLLDAYLIDSKKVQNIQGRVNLSAAGSSYGSFDTIIQNQGVYLAEGWARLPKRKRPADAVLLTYEKGKDEDIIFAISDTRVKRLDVVKVMNDRVYSMSGWQKSFPANTLPKGLVKIKAWAFDSEVAKAYKIGDFKIIKNL